MSPVEAKRIDVLVDIQNVAYLVGRLSATFLPEELVERRLEHVMPKLPKILGELQNATENYIRGGEPDVVNKALMNLRSNVQFIK